MNESLGPVWRYIAASVRGTSHANGDLVCQDSSLVRTVHTRAGPVLIACVSDGAGSASHSEIGSAWACETLADEISDYLASGRLPCEATRADADTWCVNVHRCLVARAEEAGVTPRQLACTLMGAAVSPIGAVYVHIGDGAIVVNAGEEYVPIFWPQNGQYANMTYFITEAEALTHVQFAVSANPPNEVALLSDGLQALALKFDSKSAYSPFFRALFSPVRAEPAGESQRLTRALEAFLDSEKVNARTDDDKTLVLATRLAPSARGATRESGVEVPPSHSVAEIASQPTESDAAPSSS